MRAGEEGRERARETRNRLRGTTLRTRAPLRLVLVAAATAGGERGGGDARDPPPSPIVSNRCLYSSAGVGALVPCSTLSANVIVIVGADRPDAGVRPAALLLGERDRRPLGHAAVILPTGDPFIRGNYFEIEGRRWRRP